jgi:unsaturated chondroitin disaccharide hydrolase
MAAALLDVGALHPDPLLRQRWRAEGGRLLRGLCEHYLARDPAHRGLLLHGCYSKPHNIGADAAVMFGDYYFVEAIARLQFPGKFVKSFDPLPA